MILTDGTDGTVGTVGPMDGPVLLAGYQLC